MRALSDTTRLRALTEAGLLHPNPDAVLAPLFADGSGFFLAADKVQVKYEMLRAHLVDAMPVSEAAAAQCFLLFHEISAMLIHSAVTRV